MDLHYYDTFITVSEDCRASEAVIPEPRNGKPTVASIQWSLLHDRPYELTQEDVLFESWLRRQPTEEIEKVDISELRAAFFTKPQACLRSSPLPKTYGWGLHFDGAGRVALVALNSPEYQALLASDSVTIRKGMRSKRA